MGGCGKGQDLRDMARLLGEVEEERDELRQEVLLLQQHADQVCQAPPA